MRTQDLETNSLKLGNLHLGWNLFPKAIQRTAENLKGPIIEIDINVPSGMNLYAI